MRERMGAAVLFAAVTATACSPGVFSATSVAVRPDAPSIQPGEETDFVADATGGIPFATGAVRWSVDPLELGTIDAHGHFTAGPRSGVGSITASLGSVSASARVTVACPTTRVVHDVSFNVRCTETADVYAEVRLSDDDAAAAAALADSDATAIERDFARRYGTRALIYVFADPTSYLAGVRRIFGERTFEEATEADAFFAPWVDAIAIDWQEIRTEKPVTALRHELTHRLVWRISGYDERPTKLDGVEKEAARQVPTWLDEGLAHIEESTAPGAGWKADLDRLFVAAMVKQSGPTSLHGLSDLKAWNGRTGDKALYQYLYAAQAVRLLESNIHRSGVVDILERLRGGATFREAYRGATGTQFDNFNSGLGPRLRAGITLPGVTATRYGDHTAFVLLYGFAAGQLVSYSITGPATLTASDRMDSYGNYIVLLGEGYPAGTYVVAAAGGGAPTGAKYTITK